MKNQANKSNFRKILLSSILLIILGCHSSGEQKTEQKNLNENKSNGIEINLKECIFSTENDQKSEGINMEIPYPCEWKIDNGQNQNVIKKFSKVNIDGSAIEEMLFITNMEMKLSETQITRLLSRENLSNGMDLGKDKLITGERLLIDGKPSAKMVYETSLKNQGATIASVVVQYIIVHKEYLIRLQFGTFSTTGVQANALYLENKNLFTTLATKTKFYDN